MKVNNQRNNIDNERLKNFNLQSKRARFCVTGPYSSPFSNPTDLQKMINRSLGSALVNSSATCCSVVTYWKSTFLSACFSRTKWCCIAICYVREWNYGFFSRAMTPWLSPKMTVAVGSSSSLRSWERSGCSQIASLVAWVFATYSASQEDKKTAGYLFEDQLIAPLPILNKNSEIEQRVSISLTSSKLVYPTNGIRSPRKINSNFVVPRRDSMIHFVVRIGWGSEFPRYLLRNETEWAISTRDSRIAYISDRIALAYQFLSSWEHSYPSGKASILLVSIGVTAGLALSVPKSQSTFSMYLCWLKDRICCWRSRRTEIPK